MAEAPDKQAFLQALTTEHFTLQSARSATISDSSGRSSLYLGSVSSALIALAFIGQVSELGQGFFLFGLAVLPTLFFLGLVTYVRVLQSIIEDIFYAQCINRIRRYYADIDPDKIHYFAASAGDERAGALVDVVLHRPHWQLFFTTASTIAVVNSVVGGAGVALAVGVVTGISITSAALIGILASIVSIILHLVHQARCIQSAEAKMAQLM